MPVFAFVFWIFFVWLAGWLFFPISRRLWGDFPDGGLAAGRILFLAFWTLLAFWGGILGLSTHACAWFYGFLAVAGVFFWQRETSSLQRDLTRQKRAVWGSETLFLTVFLLFFVLRGFWSDTDGTNGEKAMDSALIGALFRANHLPPPNPYAAGARLQSYYYFGHLQTALLTHLSGTIPRWSYNLMCATLPALCFPALFSLGAALTGRLRGGLTVAGLVLCCGTLQPLFQWWQQWKTPSPWPDDRFLHLDFFATSRVIPFSINEFPWFTFNQADLHGHYFAFPLALAMLCLAWALFSKASSGVLVAATAVAGAQILTNTWDFPAYFFLAALAIWLGQKDRWWATFPLALGAVFVAAPYLLGLKTAANPPRLLTQPASPPLEWLTLWGPIGLAWGLFLWKRLQIETLGIFFLGGMVLAAKYPVLGILTFFLAATLNGAFKLRQTDRFLCLMALCGLLALLWSETTYAGFLDVPNHRQDTVFKFGLQAWFLWGSAAACGVILTLKSWPIAVRWLYVPALAVMLASSCAVSFGRAEKFQKRQKWDAWAHLSPSEQHAAAWLQSQAQDGQNLMEAEQKEGGDYSHYGRFTHATGIPAVIGPQAHSFQWAPDNSPFSPDERAELANGATNSQVMSGKQWREVVRRKELVRLFFTTPEKAAQAAILDEFKVRFIVCGELEREQYGDVALERLATHFPVVFRAGDAFDERRVVILETPEYGQKTPAD